MPIVHFKLIQLLGDIESYQMNLTRNRKQNPSPKGSKMLRLLTMAMLSNIESSPPNPTPKTIDALIAGYNSQDRYHLRISQMQSLIQTIDREFSSPTTSLPHDIYSVVSPFLEQEKQMWHNYLGGRKFAQEMQKKTPDPYGKLEVAAGCILELSQSYGLLINYSLPSGGIPLNLD